MSVIDKEKLVFALRYSSSSDVKLFKNFCWAGQCSEGTPPLDSLHVNGIDSSICIPISYLDIRCIKKILCSAPNDQTFSSATLANSSSSRINVEGSLYDLAYSALNQIMGLNLLRKNELSVTILLIKLTVSTPEGCYQKMTLPIHTNNLGTFWKLILQVPVEGGYEGGRLKVGNAEDSSTFCFQHQSDRHFYAAVFLSNHKHEWQYIERGNMVALEYDIVWRPSPTLVVSSISLHDFLMCQDLTEKALNAWNVVTNKRILEKIFSKVICESLAAKGDDEPADVLDSILIIPLEEQYHETHFSFSALRGNDSKMAHILQSIDFIDVHLAVISENAEEKNFSSNCSSAPSSSLQIVQWIYSGISLPQFWKYSLDRKTLVGDNKNSLNTLGGLGKFPSQMLVLQPRCQSILRCCEAEFDVILSYLESQINCEGYSRATRSHMQVVACLGQVLEYCQMEPLKIWDVPAAKAAERTRRLIKICQDLRAQKESFFLLRILGTDFFKFSKEKLHPPKILYEGIRNELVARSTVEMVLSTGGWHIFGTLVARLITPKRIQQQLRSFIVIVDVLIEYGCIDGAVDVARQIFYTLKLIPSLRQGNYRPTNLAAYVDTTIGLSKRAGARFSLEQYVFPVFSLLTLDQQILLWIDLKLACNSRIKIAPWCHDIYDEALSLITVDFHRCINKLIETMKCLAIDPPSLVKGDHKRADLSRFFRCLFQLDQIPLLADSNRLESFVPIYAEMPENRLENLISDLIGMNVMKNYPSSHTALLNMGRSLLNRDYLLRGPPPVQLFVKLLKEFSFLTQENRVVSRQFVQIICQTDKWSPRNLILLFTAIFSSEIWSHRSENLDVENAIFKSLTELMTSWIARLVDYKTEFKSDVLMEPDVRMNVAACFISYFQEAKKGYALRNDIFSSLLNSMSMEELSHLLWDIYQADIKQDSSLKEFPQSFDLYRNLCRRLVNCDEKSCVWISNWASSNPVDNCIETIICLLWFGDDDSNSVLTKIILASNSDSIPNVVISKIIESDEILQLAYSLPHAKNSLRLLLEKRRNTIIKLLEANGRPWQMPNVKLPEHPTVQEFLHSAHTEMIYANFSNTEQANKLAEVLSLCGEDRGYTVNVEIVGTEFKTICKIVKVDLAKEVGLRLDMKEVLLIANEEKELTKALFRIQSNFQSVADVETDTPAKKRKKDFSDSDIIEL